MADNRNLNLAEVKLSDIGLPSTQYIEPSDYTKGKLIPLMPCLHMVGHMVKTIFGHLMSYYEEKSEFKFLPEDPKIPNEFMLQTYCETQPELKFPQEALRIPQAFINYFAEIPEQEFKLEQIKTQIEKVTKEFLENHYYYKHYLERFLPLTDTLFKNFAEQLQQRRLDIKNMKVVQKKQLKPPPVYSNMTNFSYYTNRALHFVCCSRPNVEEDARYRSELMRGPLTDEAEYYLNYLKDLNDHKSVPAVREREGFLKHHYRLAMIRAATFFGKNKPKLAPGYDVVPTEVQHDFPLLDIPRAETDEKVSSPTSTSPRSSLPPSFQSMEEFGLEEGPVEIKASIDTEAPTPATSGTQVEMAPMKPKA